MTRKYKGGLVERIGKTSNWKPVPPRSSLHVNTYRTAEADLYTLLQIDKYNSSLDILNDLPYLLSRFKLLSHKDQTKALLYLDRIILNRQKERDLPKYNQLAAVQKAQKSSKDALKSREAAASSLSTRQTRNASIRDERIAEADALFVVNNETNKITHETYLRLIINAHEYLKAWYNIAYPKDLHVDPDNPPNILLKFAEQDTSIEASADSGVCKSPKQKPKPKPKPTTEQSEESLLQEAIEESAMQARILAEEKAMRAYKVAEKKTMQASKVAEKKLNSLIAECKNSGTRIAYINLVSETDPIIRSKQNFGDLQYCANLAIEWLDKTQQFINSQKPPQPSHEDQFQLLSSLIKSHNFINSQLPLCNNLMHEVTIPVVHKIISIQKEILKKVNRTRIDVNLLNIKEQGKNAMAKLSEIIFEIRNGLRTDDDVTLENIQLLYEIIYLWNYMYNDMSMDERKKKFANLLVANAKLHDSTFLIPPFIMTLEVKIKKYKKMFADADAKTADATALTKLLADAKVLQLRGGKTRKFKNY